MQRIRLLTVGTIKKPWVRDGFEEFKKRLTSLADFELVELPASKEKDSKKQIQDESDRLLKVLDGKEMVVLLDEHGKEMTTKEYADFLSAKKDMGSEVVFVVGGAYGVDERVKEKADLLLSLGSMTLPHELVRIVFLEGLYRALDLARGGKYHH
jgi:23S rRNA (pseudouridine1915-N3)-methyltransferase